MTAINYGPRVGCEISEQEECEMAHLWYEGAKDRLRLTELAGRFNATVAATAQILQQAWRDHYGAAAAAPAPKRRRPARRSA